MFVSVVRSCSVVLIDRLWSPVLLLLLLPGPSRCVHYSKEVCQNEHFQAACPSGHVIMMTTVLYGRMRFGRCVKTNFGYVGCYNDVTGHVHRRCSGRQTCSIRIPDSGMDRTNPCNDDLKSYLEANYTCIKITTRGRDDKHFFHHSDSPCSLQLDETNPQIYLLYSQLQKPPNYPKFSPCSLTWVVGAKSGQRISIELYDFSTIPTLLPANNNQSKTPQTSSARRSPGSNSNSKRPQIPQQQSVQKLDLDSYPLVSYHLNEALRPVLPPRTLVHSPSTFSSSSSSENFLQQKPSSHCLISVVNVHDLINVTATDETFEITPSYTLCGSDLNALDAELKIVMKEKSAKMKILETWLQAYESRGNSVRLEMLRSHLPEAVYLLKLEATGCPRIDETFADDVTVTQYDVSTLKIECKKNGRVVYLLCNGTRWNGSVTDCDSIDTAFSTQMDSSGIFSFGTVTLVGLILIWSVAVAILFLGLCYFRKKKLEQMKQGSDIGLKDLKPLNSQDAMYDVTNQDIYAKNQAFETTTTKTQMTPSTPEGKHSLSKVGSSSSTLPSTSNPSAVAILLPSRKTTSLLASKTRPAAIEFCTRVWQSPEASRKNREGSSSYPTAPVMTFHPTVSRRHHHPQELQLPALQQQHHQLPLNDYQAQEPQQLPYSPHVRQPQMLGLRAVWIDNGDCCGGYQNAVVNQTYSLPDKSRKLKTGNLVVLSQCNEYENDDDKGGYVQQRRLPLPPSPNAPLLTLAFRNATYNTWNANPMPSRNAVHYGNGSAITELDNDVI